MGFACPACDSVHHDAEHLANHLAVTAMLGSDEHEAWLDEHAPGWNDSTPRELGALLREHVEEESFPELDDVHDHGDDEPRGGDLFEDEPELREPPRDAGSAGASSVPGGTPGGSPNADASGGAGVSAIMDEAREMTERMLEKRDRGDDEERDE